MRSVTKPKIAALHHSNVLDALHTHVDTTVRVAASVFVAAFRPPAHASRICSAFEILLRGLALLEERHPNLGGVVRHARTGVQLLLQTVRDQGLVANHPDHPVEEWLATAPTYGTLLMVPPDDEQSLIALAAAYVKAQFSGVAVPARFAKKILSQASSPVQELAAGPAKPRGWSQTHQNDIEWLARLAAGSPAESDSDFQRAACVHFIWRTKAPGLNDRLALFHHRCLTKDSLLSAAKALRVGFVDGSGLAAAIGAGLFSGLTWNLVQRIPLHKPADGDGWVIWLDLQEGCYRNNLNPVVREAASARGNTNYIPATREFPRALPHELLVCLRHLLQRNPEAHTVGELCDTTEIPAEHEITLDDERVLKSSIARLFNTRAAISKMLRLSGPIAALCLGDFARVAHSKFFYHSSTQHQLDDALDSVARLLGWGPIRHADSSVGILGAAVVPEAATIAAIARELAAAVFATAPPRRYQWEHIRQYHNAYARYCAFLISLGLHGRDRGSMQVHGATLAAATGVVGVKDKATNNKRGASQVVVCRQVGEQLKHWFEHLRNLQERMKKCGIGEPVLSARIAEVLDGSSASILFEIDEDNQPIDCGSREAYSAVTEDIAIKADSARHFWERVFTEHGIDDKYIDAQSRRQVRWSESWHSTSSMRGTKFRRVIATIQERALEHLEIKSIRGLVK